MNEEMMELLMQSAMELMEPTRTRLREQNPVFEEGRSVCGELEKKFDVAVEALRNVNAEMADLFEEHYNAYEHWGYQTELFSYVQGYLDCVQLLSGLGVLNGVNQKWIDTFLKRYPMQRLYSNDE